MIEKSPIKFIWGFVKNLKWLFAIFFIALFSNEFLIRYVLVYASELINLISSFTGNDKSQIKDVALKLVFIIELNVKRELRKSSPPTKSHNFQNLILLIRKIYWK